MTKFTRRTVLTAILTLALTPVGCALLDPDSPEEAKAREVRALCYSAASIGTAAALEQKPEWRPAFELAYTNLNTLVETKQITGQTFRDVLATLPVKELKSQTARIAIESATMLFDTLTGQPVGLEKAPLVLAAGTGVRDGMKVGLGK